MTTDKKMVEEKEAPKIVVMAILVGICCALTYYFHVVLEIGTTFTHFFYIPVILAALWWKRKGLLVAIFLAAVIFFSHVFVRVDAQTINDLFRASMLLVVGIVAAILSERIAEAQARITRERDFSENIIATVPDSLLVLDKDLRIKSANRAFYETFQTEPDKAIGSSIADIVHDKDGTLSTELTKLFENGDMLENFELHYQSEKLGERIFNVRARGILIEEEVVVVLEEITERKRAEEALRESEAQYHGIFDSTTDSFLIFDLDGNIVDANPQACKMYGYPYEELITLSGKDIVHPDYYHLFEQFKRDVQTVDEFHAESVDIHKDGTAFNIEVRGTDFNYKGRKQLLAVIRDITEQKRMVETLRRFSEELELKVEERTKETPFEHRILVVDDEKDLCAYLKRELEKEGYQVAVSYDGSDGLQYFKNNRVDVVISDIRMPELNGFKMLQECREISDDFVPIIITGFSDHENAIEALRLGVFGYLKKPLSLEEVINVVDKGINLLSLRRGLCIHERELEIENALKTQYAEKIEKSLKEKEVMLKEIHHRVKNNLQVISSLLSLQSRHIKDKEALELFNDSRSRIYSMSLIHERLYRSKDLARIDFAGYVRTLTRGLFRSYRGDPNDIKLNMEIKDVFLNVNAGIPCGLIINELVTNSLKHGFPDGRRGEIQIGLYERKKGEFTLNVRDNGIGLPEDLDFRNTESLGMHIVLSLVEQLDGTIELDRGEGTSFTIRFRALK
jgi:PAS domain S-box-containing protein